MSQADIAASAAAANVTDLDVSVTRVYAESSAAASSEQAELHKHIDSLKHDYADVFAEPSGLPPDRGVEHVSFVA